MENIATSKRIRRGLLLKTGQTTSYGSGTGVDDGALQKGVDHRYTVLTAGQYSGTTNITINSKTDTHSNACVFDETTGLMWSRTISASVGPTSNGLLPWTTTGSGGTAEGIFPYVAVANAASLSGWTDWRIPNRVELVTMLDMEATTAQPDSTAFPSIASALNIWSATTQPSNTANGINVNTQTGASNTNAKTNTGPAWLVRGPL